MADGAPHCGACGAPLPWLVAATSADFAPVAERGPLSVLVDFWAPWCGPCRVVAPVGEQAARTYAGRLKVVKVDTDAAPDLAERFSISGIPTLVLLRDGRVVDRVTGALDRRSLEAWLQRHLSGARTA